MDNILSWWIIYSLAPCFILSYILIYFCRPLYTLLYILHSPAYFTPLLYTLLYAYYIPPLYTYYYILLYILSTLLYSYNIINLAPAVLYPSLIPHLSLLYTCHRYFHIPLPSYYSTLLYRKGITTLPPIFTRFTSLS